MAKRNLRITKKLHTRYLADFFIEVSQDAQWNAKLQELGKEARINTSEVGFPENFVGFFPETETMDLSYSIERLELNDVPRSAACWWPVDEGTQYYMAYPTNFPQATIYMAIDFDDHDHAH